MRYYQLALSDFPTLRIMYMSVTSSTGNRIRLRAKQPQQVREITILMFVNPDTDVKKEADRCLHILYRSFSTSLHEIGFLPCEITSGRDIANYRQHYCAKGYFNISTQLILISKIRKDYKKKHNDQVKRDNSA